MKATGALSAGNTPVWGLQTKQNESRPDASTFQQGWNQFYDGARRARRVRLLQAFKGVNCAANQPAQQTVPESRSAGRSALSALLAWRAARHRRQR